MAVPVVAVTVTGAVSPPVPGVVAGWFVAARPAWASGCVAGVDGFASLVELFGLGLLFLWLALLAVGRTEMQSAGHRLWGSGLPTPGDRL